MQDQAGVDLRPRPHLPDGRGRFTMGSQAPQAVRPMGGDRRVIRRSDLSRAGNSDTLPPTNH